MYFSENNLENLLDLSLFPALQRLDLDQNGIAALPDDYIRGSQLTSLDLSGNNVFPWPDIEK